MGQPVPYGKYQLIERLASGAMADVFRAITQKADGGNLVVVVKRIRAEASSNPEFANMFLEEARITSLLNHPNIARVYEWGKQADTFFIAMEYIEGTNLASLLQSLAEQGLRFPPTLGVYIADEVLKGLAYAHGQKDAYGNNLGIVHRGVSPPNIVLSSDGKVKLVDFGLAKATFRSRPTAPGVFRGRYTYIAPEQLRHQPVDARADIFSVGVVLYEMLTGLKLKSEGDEGGIQAVVGAAAARPPSSVFPDIPTELDGLVRRAMAEDPNSRPAGAEQLCTDLSAFLNRWDRQVDADALSSFLVETLSGRAMGKPKEVGFSFGEATSQWMARGENLEELVKIDPGSKPKPAPPAKAAADDFLAEFGSGAPAAAAPAPRAVAQPPPAPEPAPEPVPEPKAEPEPEPAPPPEPKFVAPRGRFAAGETVMAVEASGLGKGRQLKTLLLVLGMAAVLVVAVILILKGLSKDEGVVPKHEQPAAPPEEKYAGEIEVRTTPEAVVVFVDGDPFKPDGKPPKLLGVRAGSHQVKLAAPGYLPWEGELTFEIDKPGLIERKLEERKGRLILNSVPPGALVFLDGKKVGKTPKTFENLASGKSYKVMLTAKHFKDLKFNVEPTDWPDDPKADLKIEKKLEKPAPPKGRGR